MSENKWKKEICTVPNLLSLFRLLLIPIYLHCYREKAYLLAGAILTLSCLTDLADGWIARKFHMISNLGKVLDPLADKLTQFFLLLSLARIYPMIRPMLVLFLIKELFQLGTMLVFIRKGKVLEGALYAGKLCTCVLFVSLTVLVTLPDVGRNLLIVLISADTALLLYAFYNYFLAYFGRNTKLTDLETE